MVACGKQTSLTPEFRELQVDQQLHVLKTQLDFHLGKYRKVFPLTSKISTWIKQALVWLLQMRNLGGRWRNRFYRGARRDF